jgi:hypothetical protein
MDSKNESVAVRAAEALLDRGYGRPMQGMELIDKSRLQLRRTETHPTPESIKVGYD